ncbi:MAG: DUF1501 domain-containing protein [Acidobacteria bacterium]|nr:DUF1501 domain-containing protein [Acidobacteriota bacterium]
MDARAGVSPRSAGRLGLESHRVARIRLQSLGGVMTARDRTHSYYRRRDFIRAGALGMLGISLPRFLQLQAAAAAATQPKAKAQACILLWLEGGPSQVDTWDPKPNSSFKPISTNVPGIQLSSLLPGVARHMEKLAIIRSMPTLEQDHDPAVILCDDGTPSESRHAVPQSGVDCVERGRPAERASGLRSGAAVGQEPGLRGVLQVRFPGAIVQPDDPAGRFSGAGSEFVQVGAAGANPEPAIALENCGSQLPPDRVTRAVLEPGYVYRAGLEHDFVPWGQESVRPFAGAAKDEGGLRPSRVRPERPPRPALGGKRVSLRNRRRVQIQ